MDRIKEENINTVEFYDKFYDNANTEGRGGNYQFIVNDLRDKRGDILDVCCGTGEGCKLMHDELLEMSISGCDFSPKAIGICGDEMPEINHFFVWDIRNEFPHPALFDYVTCVQSLEHIDDPFAAIDKMLQLCAKAVYISVPYDTYMNGEPAHVNRFNIEDFKRYEEDYDIIVSVDNWKFLRITIKKK